MMITTLKKVFLNIAAIAFTLSLIACSSEPELTVDPELQQAVFTTPEEAATAFYSALSHKNSDNMAKLLGADYKDVLPLGELSDKDTEQFIQKWNKQQTLTVSDDKTQFISVGDQHWNMPIPLTMSENKQWYFDVQQGINIMSLRRIGRNELRAIQAVLTYRSAQIEYAEQDHDGDGILEYAQKLISSPGKQDGLLWEGNKAPFASHLSELITDKSHDGSFHGYQYKILHSQRANDLVQNYIVDGSMSDGFALVAWPVAYDESGIVTFMLDKDGIVYERDLGEDTAKLAEALTEFNPTRDWRMTDKESLKP